VSRESIPEILKLTKLPAGTEVLNDGKPVIGSVKGASIVGGLFGKLPDKEGHARSTA
jgi:hypothetical protein